MNDEEETEMEETETTRDPAKWSWITFWSILVAAVGAYFNLIAIVWAQVSDLLDKHNDWKVEQGDMLQRAALEIEALTRDPVPLEAKR